VFAAVDSVGDGRLFGEGIGDVVGVVGGEDDGDGVRASLRHGHVPFLERFGDLSGFNRFRACQFVVASLVLLAIILAEHFGRLLDEGMTLPVGVTLAWVVLGIGCFDLNVLETNTLAVLTSRASANNEVAAAIGFARVDIVRACVVVLLCVGDNDVVEVEGLGSSVADFLM